MATNDPVPPKYASGGARYGFNPARFGLMGVLVLALVFLSVGIYVWFFCRIEPPSGFCAVLVRKDGNNIPANDIIAVKPEQKGVQLEPLSEGRYFYNPINWSWKMEPLTQIKEGEVGIMVRQFGAPPPAGKFIVAMKEADGTMRRGIIDEPLRPGTYRINPFAYRVEKRPAVKIEPGEVGVVTLLYGKTPEAPNTFLVKETEQGVQEGALRPGTYYLNPYIQRVDIVGVQSHKTEFEISFLSKDGFRFPVKGAVEWAVEETRAPEVFVMIGDGEDIVNKVILRSALSMSRVQGSKYSSADVISGTVRKAFQDEFSKHIASESARKGILVKAALISEIEPPQKIAEPIREREIAVQTRTKYEREVERAITDANVAEQKKLQDQKVRIVKAETMRKNEIQRANKNQQVQVIGAQRDLEVAKKDLETAEKRALAIVSTGQGDADVISYTRKAEASALKAVVTPFGSGSAYARYLYLNKIAPNIQSILSNSDGPLAEPFRELSKPDVKGGAK
ncbi:MAG: SPFH domain-containing protein [Verrucomicrobiota bacterium]